MTPLSILLRANAFRVGIAGLWMVMSAGASAAVDLLQRYPTGLTAADTAAERARPWTFDETDIFRVSGFRLEIGEDLRVEMGEADLGIGHCADGAVWGLLMPRGDAELTHPGAKTLERIRHVWLRFHPGQITRLFPPETVFEDGSTRLAAQMRTIAGVKINASWHAGPNATIPEPKDGTVDADTVEGVRRFFVVDTQAGTAEYIAAFEQHAIPVPGPFDVTSAEQAFDQLWESFDRDYAMFVLRPEVDWAALRDQYRPRVKACESVYEVADLLADMLRPLRDLHVWLMLGGQPVPVFNRPRAANANPRAHEGLLGRLQREGPVQWAVTADQIGYIGIYGWNDPGIPDRVDKILERMRDTRGLILDVRLNGGGDEPLAQQVAGRFLAEPFTYAYSRYRNGPAHTDLTGRYERKVVPRGPWRYDCPVIVLIGQKDMSSNESFIGMMTGAPQAITMGDRTCGSSGNPRMVELPLGMTVSVPKWIDYLPDGTPLDERGFQPRVPFAPEPGAFQGDRDDLLSAALERLRQVPLPEKPIAGPAFRSDEDQEAADETRPMVVSVVPADGAQDVDPATEIKIRSDRPMNPLSAKPSWESGGFFAGEFPEYDTNRCEYTFAVRLCPGADHQIVVNQPMGSRNLLESRASFPGDGFLPSDHSLARRFAWYFRTAGSGRAPNTEPPRVRHISPDRMCMHSKAWTAEVGSETTVLGSHCTWWIDSDTLLPTRIEQYSPGIAYHSRFLYDAVDVALSAAAFAVPDVEGLEPSPPEPLDADYTHRFVNLQDGSDGSMSVRWGKQGPHARSSSGLN